MIPEFNIDSWFFNEPACSQSDISGIIFNEEYADDDDYERFDDAVVEWWDSLTYEEKLDIYKSETMIV
jgi:hypothetical protein